ncbi:MAG: hypothetical protein ACRDX8_03240 [Acidimicrobiales bacterium]
MRTVTVRERDKFSEATDSSQSESSDPVESALLSYSNYATFD